MLNVSRLVLAIAALANSGAALALDNDVKANYGTVSPAYTQAFGDSFSAAPAPTEFKPVNWPGGITLAGFNFYDDFVFTIGSGGSFSGGAITIDLGSFLGIDNFQARIYSIASLADLTNDTPSAGTLAQAWSTPINGGNFTGTALVFGTPITLLAGQTYALELRGLVTGSAGGSYGGNFNISAVPEADGWMLSMFGLGALGLVRRRRR